MVSLQDVVGFVMTVNLIKKKLSDSDVGGADGGKETKAHKGFYSQ